MPDFKVGMPAGADVLMELKALGGGPTHYATGELCRGFAVAARARAIPREYRLKAQRLDETHCGARRGVPGPVALKLAGFGRLWGLVFGAYGEASEDVHELVRTLSTSYAARHWTRLGAREPAEAAAACASTLCRSWGLTAARGQARLLLAGLGHVGAGAAAAAGRRSSAETWHRSRREAAALLHPAR